jgi:adenylate kinase
LKLFKTIYLTGAPASGKTTASRELIKVISDIELWSYSDQLMRYVNKTKNSATTHEKLREQSATIIAPEDIIEVDKLLIRHVQDNRRLKHIIIDSHPVTKEAYGFRCTAFSLDQIKAVAPDEIWVIFADPQTLIDRITANSGGRSAIDAEAARMHTFLQASVATTYGISIGRPVYFFNSNQPLNELVERLRARLS